MKKMLLLLIALTVPMFTVAQTDVSTILKGGEIILSGLSILKAAKSDPKSEEKKNSKIIESVCVKNKLLLGITIRITGKDEEGNDIKKELVIPKDGKECLFLLPKGIYT